MPIINNIPRKHGKINPHPTGVPKNYGINFGNPGRPTSGVPVNGNISDPEVYKMAGVSYNQVSSTGGNTHPLSTFRNTGTLSITRQLSSVGASQAVPQKQVPLISPHERGKFFAGQGQKFAPVRRSGGVDDTTNTPFHPKPQPTSKYQFRPARAGERTSEPSFISSGTLQSHIGTGISRGSRWGTVKRSASDAPAATHTPPPQTGIPVGTGSTGYINTGKPQQAPQDSNAHSGTPFVLPWNPNRRGIQPNERGNTNPLPKNRSCRGCP